MFARPLVAYALLYILALLALTGVEGQSPVEPLFVLVMFGFALPGLAWWSTRGLQPRTAPVHSPSSEMMATTAYLIALAAFITWGLPAVRGLASSGQGAEVGVLFAKVVVFILLPYLVWTSAFKCRWSELFDLRGGLTGHWRPTLVMAAAVVAFQAVFGRASREWSGITTEPATIGLAAVGCFLWLLLDAGLVEELPFRGLLQTRLAAATQSDVAAVIGMAICFGLAHAPGLYLRPELMGEAVGAHPSLLRAVSYSLAVTSVASFPYGILWLRTRNLWVVACVHAAQDWLPALVDTLRTGVLGA